MVGSGFEPLLNGFFVQFDMVLPLRAQPWILSVSNVVPKTISGDYALQGIRFLFEYAWEYSPYDLSDTTVISGAVSLAYTPSSLVADTIWIRRIVTGHRCYTNRDSG